MARSELGEPDVGLNAPEDEEEGSPAGGDEGVQCGAERAREKLASLTGLAVQQVELGPVEA